MLCALFCSTWAFDPLAIGDFTYIVAAKLCPPIAHFVCFRIVKKGAKKVSGKTAWPILLKFIHRVLLETATDWLNVYHDNAIFVTKVAIPKCNPCWQMFLHTYMYAVTCMCMSRSPAMNCMALTYDDDIVTWYYLCPTWSFDHLALGNFIHIVSSCKVAIPSKLSCSDSWFVWV